MTVTANILRARYRRRTNEYVVVVVFTYDNPAAGEEGQPATITSRKRLTVGDVPRADAPRNAFLIQARDEIRRQIRIMMRKIDRATEDVVDPDFEGEDITLGP